MSGGAELVCDELVAHLKSSGNMAELVCLPFKWYPTTQLLLNTVAWRSLDLSEVNGQPIDLVVATKFPSYALKHRHKVVWLFHQHRQAYDLLGTPYSDLNEEKSVCDSIRSIDESSLKEAEKLFALSNTVRERLRKYNGLDADVLYAPPPGLETFHHGNNQDFVLVPSGLHKLKRVDLLIRSVPHLDDDVRVIIAGDGPEQPTLDKLANDLHVRSRVEFVRTRSRSELAELYANSLCVYYGPFQEDYGLVTAEAFLSGKPVVTTVDAGGPIEFVENGKTGFAAAPEPSQIADRLNELWHDKEKAAKMGLEAQHFVMKLELNWENVIRRLIGS
jgi:glycosyltransferase involved in cell wall biosynthesis